MNNAIQRKILDWLKSGSTDVCYVKHDQDEYAYFRHQIRDDLDVIYAYDEVQDEQIIYGASVEYQALYKKSTDELYVVSHTIEKIFGENRFDATSLCILEYDFREKVRECIETEVRKWKITIDDEMREKLTPFAESAAINRYLYDRGDEFEYYSDYDINNFKTIVLDYVVNPKETIRKNVEKYCTKYKQNIYEDLIYLELTKEFLKEYRANKNILITTMKTIKNSIPDDCCMVNITTLIDGEEATFKCEARILREGHKEYDIIRYLEKKSQNEFERVYGDKKSFSLMDISKITYSRKVLYERSKQQ